MAILAVVIIFLLMTILWAAFTWLFSALAVSAANAWIMQGTFADGWAACWDRWWVLLLWAFVFSCSINIVRR